MMKPLLFCFFIGLFWVCAPSKTTLDKGPFDTEINRYLRRLDGKKKKTRHLRGLETAFQQAQIFDLALVDSLLEENRPELWPTVNALHRRLQIRQRKVAVLEPLRSKDGYEPQLYLVSEIAGREAESRHNAATYLYDKAQRLLKEAVEMHNPPAARQAFYTLKDLKQNYYRYWENANTLYDSTLKVGVTYVLINNLPGKDSIADRAFWKNVSTQTQKLNDNWHQYYSTPSADRAYNYVVECRVEAVTVGAENRSESTRTETKEVEVGKEEIRDTSGHVVCTKPIYERVSADVHEISVSKTASGSLTVEVRHAYTNAVVFSKNLPGSYDASETASYYSGDSRALSSMVTSLSASPSTPSDSWMVESLMGNLQYGLFRFLKKNLKDL